MTTNKPEVVARLLTWAGPRYEPVPWEGVCARTFAEFPLENPFHGHWKEGEPLIRLSDYEDLQAECEKLVQSLEECVGWLEWMYHPQTSDKVGKARIQRANRALAPFRNKESK